MNREHYTIEEYSELLAGEAEQEKEEKMQEHLEECDLCKVKMRASTLLSLLEDDEVLELTMHLMMDEYKNKGKDLEPELNLY